MQHALLGALMASLGVLWATRGLAARRPCRPRLVKANPRVARETPKEAIRARSKACYIHKPPFSNALFSVFIDFHCCFFDLHRFASMQINESKL